VKIAKDKKLARSTRQFFAYCGIRNDIFWLVLQFLNMGNQAIGSLLWL